MGKRYVIGGCITLLTICTVIIFNSVICTWAFSSTSEKGSMSVVDATIIETIAAASEQQTTTSEQEKSDNAKTSQQIDVNAISKEEAIKYAASYQKVIKLFGNAELTGTAFYSQGTGPTGPNWMVYLTRGPLTNELQESCCISVNALNGEIDEYSSGGVCYVKSYGSGIYVTTDKSIDFTKTN